MLCRHRFILWLRVVTACALIVCGAPIVCEGQEGSPSLRLESDHFLVDDGARFLIFVSYFDALRAHDRDPASVRSDFRFLKEHGIDGVRIFPNWQNGGTVFRPDGSLDGARLTVLKSVLSIARDERLVVDVSFARETVEMDIAPYKDAIARITSELTSYRNVIFDIQNERDLWDRPWMFLPEADVQDAKNRIKQVDPARVVVASNTGASGEDGVGTAAMQFALGLDGAAFHDPRYSDWYGWRVPWIIQNMWYYAPWQVRVFLQEPNAWQDDPDENHHLLALHNAKRYGAAAWTFHTRSGFDLGSESFVSRISNSGQVAFFNRVRDEMPTEGWAACNFEASPTVIDVPNYGGDFAVNINSAGTAAGTHSATAPPRPR